MARDTNHELRLRQLREDNPDWVEPAMVKDAEAVDFTGQEISRLHNDPEAVEYASQPQRFAQQQSGTEMHDRIRQNQRRQL